MKVLIACEESQRVCIAFRERGHEAYSCDMQDCSGGRPEWHIKGDALEAIRGGTIVTCDGVSHDIGKWDLLIAHPPCTYLSNAGACRLYPRKGELDMERYHKGLEAKAFFLALLDADVPRVAVENPVSSKVFGMPPHSQEIQPYQFGHPYTKKRACGSAACRRLNRRKSLCLYRPTYRPARDARTRGRTARPNAATMPKRDQRHSPA